MILGDLYVHIYIYFMTLEIIEKKILETILES